MLQSVPPWVPALSSDTLRPSQGIPHHEPLLNVKAVETGVIDVSFGIDTVFGSVELGRHDTDGSQFRLMVQECVAKTGVEQLQVGTA